MTRRTAPVDAPHEIRRYFEAMETTVMNAFRRFTAALWLIRPAIAAALAFVVLWMTVGPIPARAGFGFSEPLPLKTGNFDPKNDYNVTLESGPGGIWVAAWYAGGHYGDDEDILFQRSTDDGATWSPVSPLNSTAMTDSRPDVIPILRRSSTGTWICTWDTSDSWGDIKGTDIDVAFSRSTDEGITWSSAEVLNSTGFTDAGLDGVAVIETDGAGRWIAVWASTNRAPSETPNIFDIWFAGSTDDGLTWATAAPLNSDAAGNDNPGSPRIAIKTDADGHWVCIWVTRDDLGGTIGDDYDVLGAFSSDDGVTWSNPSPVNTNAATDSGADGGASGGPHELSWPTLVTFGGTWVAAWDSNGTLDGTKGDDADILFARSTDGGATWSDPKTLNSNAYSDPQGPAGNDLYPWLDVDAEGRMVCVWATTAYSAPNYNDLNIAVARSTDRGETWSEMTGLNFNQRTDISGYDLSPRLRCGFTGTWVCGWMTRQAAFGSQFGEYDLLFSRTTDITQPPEPPLTPAEVERVILGKYDVNEDGKIDVTDLVLLLF